MFGTELDAEGREDASFHCQGSKEPFDIFEPFYTLGNRAHVLTLWHLLFYKLAYTNTT